MRPIRGTVSTYGLPAQIIATEGDLRGLAPVPKRLVLGRTYSHALYEGARYCMHDTAKMKCRGSGTLAKFDPRPNEPQHFNAPKLLGLEGL